MMPSAYCIEILQHFKQKFLVRSQLLKLNCH